jgi:predicted Rossmann fold flavoprotein
MFDVLVIGGGAAGFYGAIHVALNLPTAKVALLERGNEVLTKVKVSGGGRCNVTHAEFDPRQLTKNYPRGEKELLGPFHSHASGDVIAFFEERGIPLKIEPDGRMFPKTDTSQTIIDCFLGEAQRLGVQVMKKASVTGLAYQEGPRPHWEVQTHDHLLKSTCVLVATGSNPKIWDLLQGLGHTIVPPVPSLFTFNIKDDRIANLPGLSSYAEITVLPQEGPALKTKKTNEGETLCAEGPVLVTHWGLSGPAVLKLSAWGAIALNKCGYHFKIRVNWAPEYHANGFLQLLGDIKKVERKTISRTKVVDLPKRLWIQLVLAAGISEDLTWPQATKMELQALADQVTTCVFQVNGKSTFKEEFVTAGGVVLNEVNFKDFGSKVCPNLFFAGEVLDIDAITGGFNFQNAWTGAYLAAQGIAAKLKAEPGQ